MCHQLKVLVLCTTVSPHSRCNSLLDLIELHNNYQPIKKIVFEKKKKKKLFQFVYWGVEQIRNHKVWPRLLWWGGYFPAWRLDECNCGRGNIRRLAMSARWSASSTLPALYKIIHKSLYISAYTYYIIIFAQTPASINLLFTSQWYLLFTLIKVSINTTIKQIMRIESYTTTCYKMNIMSFNNNNETYLFYPLGCFSNSLRTVRSQYSKTKWSFFFRRKTSIKLTRFGCFNCCTHMKHNSIKFLIWSHRHQHTVSYCLAWIIEYIRVLLL